MYRRKIIDKYTYLPIPRIPLAPRAKHFIRSDSIGSLNVVCLDALRFNS